MEGEAIVRKSALFDADWYLKTNPDVNAVGVDAAFHFCTFGWKEGRNPSPAFCTRAYLADHPDVRAAGVNPLRHYEEFGRQEGRTVRPVAPEPNRRRLVLKL
jgi:hypothetical protein